MRKTTIIFGLLLGLMLAPFLSNLAYAGFGFGLPGVIKERVEELDKTVKEKKNPPKLTANPTTVLPGGSSTITYDASDTLIYEWSATGGTISGSGHQVAWTAPLTEGTYAITCKVFDGGDEIARENVSVTVKTSGGNGENGIVGSWHYEEDAIQFNSDGSYVSNSVGSDGWAYREEGTWQLQGDSLTLTCTAEGYDTDGTVEDEDMVPEDPPGNVTFQVKISGNTLSLVLSKWQRSGDGGDGLVGTWEIFYTFDDNVLLPPEGTTAFQFNSDGSLVKDIIYEMEGAYRKVGTWQLQGNTLTFTMTAEGQDPDGTVEAEDMYPIDPPEISTGQIEISGNTLTLMLALFKY